MFLKIKCPDLLIEQNKGKSFCVAYWVKPLILENYIISKLQMNSL